MIQSYLSQKINSPIDSIDISDNLTDAQVDTVRSWNDASLFFVQNNLYVNPTKVTNPTLLTNEISSLLKIPATTITPLLTIRKRRYLEIIRKMSIHTRDMVNERIDTETLALKNNQITLADAVFPFLQINDNLVRYYPEGHTTGQITGFVDGG